MNKFNFQKLSKSAGTLSSILTIAAGFICITTPSILAVPAPIDLNTWSQKGPSANGIWTVQNGGDSVFQSRNGNPTFFVSDNDFINTTINGKFGVESTGDDDYIGFVFGYQNPQATGTDFDFFLFDWKQRNQSSGSFLAQEGFSLNRVQGNISNFLPGFWGHTDSTEFDVLATDYGSDLGWEDNTVYDFSLLYQEDRIKIDIKGGNNIFQNGKTIFDLTPGDVGLSNFTPGQFGFYNYSQANVRYQSFTEEDTPVDPDPVSTPEPASLLGFLAVGAFGANSALKRKKAVS